MDVLQGGMDLIKLVVLLPQCIILAILIICSLKIVVSQCQNILSLINAIGKIN